MHDLFNTKDRPWRCKKGGVGGWGGGDASNLNKNTQHNRKK